MQDLENFLISTVAQSVTTLVSKAIEQNPNVLEEMLGSLLNCHQHTALAVAKNALEAVDTGSLTKEQALSIVKVCLGFPENTKKVLKTVELFPIQERN